MTRLLHVLSQLPDQTGSGIYLRSLVEHAKAAGHEQAVVAGANSDQRASIPSLPTDRLSLVRFGGDDLPFDMPGMSDVMPYRSSRWSRLTEPRLQAYRRAFRRTLTQAGQRHRPRLVHVNHLWQAAALTRQVFEGVPVVASCHGTGLRQAELCPGLAQRLTPEIRRLDRILALTGIQAERIEQIYGVDPARIVVTGGAVDTDRFHPPVHSRQRQWTGLAQDLGITAPGVQPRLIYVGKLAAAKGVDSLLDAVEILRRRKVTFSLLLVGSGSGPEAERIEQRARRMADPGDAPVLVLGRLPHDTVAELLRACHIFVLPSFYEGLPLSAVEGLVSGCRLVISELPALSDWHPPGEAQLIERVPLPSMVGVDRPDEAGLPGFAKRLADALGRQVSRRDDPLKSNNYNKLSDFCGWNGLFERIEAVYRSLTERDG